MTHVLRSRSRGPEKLAMRRLSGALLPGAREPPGPLSCGGGRVRQEPPLPAPRAFLPQRLTSRRTGTTRQGWGAARCSSRPPPSRPSSSSEKGPAADSSGGGSEATRRPRSGAPLGSRRTRPSSAPSGAPRSTTWEKRGGGPARRLEGSPVTSTSSWVCRPGRRRENRGPGEKSEWLSEQGTPGECWGCQEGVRCTFR